MREAGRALSTPAGRKDAGTLGAILGVVIVAAVGRDLVAFWLADEVYEQVRRRVLAVVRR